MSSVPVTTPTPRVEPFSRSLVRRSLIVISLLTLLDNVDGNAFYGVLPLIARDFHLSDTLLGILPAAPEVFVVLATIPIAMAADRLPRTKLVGVGVLVWAGFTGLGGLATSFLTMLLLRTFVGVGFASYDAPTNSLICDLFPMRTRSRAMGVQAFAAPLGAIGGVALAGVLSAFIGWRWTFAVVGLPALVLAFLMYRLPEPPRGATDGGGALRLGPATLGDAWRGARQILRSRGMVLGTLGRGIQSFGLIGIGSFLPLFLERFYGQSNAAASGEFALVLFGALLGTLPGGFADSYLARRYAAGSRFIVAGGATTLSAILFAAALLSPSFFMLVGLACLSGFFLGATIAPLTTMVADVVVPERRSYAYAVQGLAATLIGLFAAPIVGVLSDATHNLRLALLLFVIPLLLSGLLLLARHGTQRRDAEALQELLAQRRSSPAARDAPQ